MANQFINLDNIKVVWKNIHERFQRIYAITTFDLSKILYISNDIDGKDDVLYNEKYYFMSEDSYKKLVDYLTTGLFDKTLSYDLRKFSVMGNFIYKESYPGSTDNPGVPMADIILIDDAKNIYNFKVTSGSSTAVRSINVILNKIFYQVNDINNIQDSYLGEWKLDTCPLDMTVPPQATYGTKKLSGSDYTIGDYKYKGQSSSCTFTIDKPTTYYLIDSYNQVIDLYVIKLKYNFTSDKLTNPGFSKAAFIDNIKYSYETLQNNKVDVTTLPPKKDSKGNPIKDQYLLDGLTVTSTDNIYQFTINPEFVFKYKGDTKNTNVWFALSIFRRSTNGNGVLTQYVKIAQRPYIK